MTQGAKTSGGPEGRRGLLVARYAPALAVLGFSAVLLRTAAFQRDPSGLSVAITLDLIVTVPLLYLVAIWRTSVPRWTVVSVFGLGVLSGVLLIPAEHRGLLDWVIEWILPVVEVGLVVFLVVRVRRYLTVAKTRVRTGSGAADGQDSSGEVDFYDALRTAAHDTFPSRIAPIFATEVAIPYYLLNWRPLPAPTEGQFSYHRRNGVRVMLYGFLGAIAVEVLAVHFALTLWSHTAAWIATGLGLYAGVQVVALCRSLPRRPIHLTRDELVLRFGFAGEARIPLGDIDSIESSRQSLQFKGTVRQLSSLGGLDPHNVILHVRKEHVLRRLYGIQARFTTIAFHVDEPERFVAAVRSVRGPEPDSPTVPPGPER